MYNREPDFQNEWLFGIAWIMGAFSFYFVPVISICYVLIINLHNTLVFQLVDIHQLIFNASQSWRHYGIKYIGRDDVTISELNFLKVKVVN